MFSHPRHSKWRGYVPNLQIKSQWQQNFFWINLWFANERQVHGEGECAGWESFARLQIFRILDFRSGLRFKVLAATSLWTRGRSGAAPSPWWTPSPTPHVTGSWRPGTPRTGSTPSPVSPPWSPRASGDADHQSGWDILSEWLLAQVFGASRFEHSWYLQSGLQQEESW